MVKQVPSVEIHDDSARIVKGWGTVDVFDKANERLPIEEFKRIMPIIMKRGGLIMNKHSNQPVGKILNYEFRMKDTPSGPKEGVYLTTEVFKDWDSDDEVWRDIKRGGDDGFKGFSFGGRNKLEDVEFSKGVSKKTLKGLEGHEFSYVPSGCNQESTFEEINYIAKEDKGEEGETSTDSDHYHLYKINEAGDGQTITTLPREYEDHTHKIESGIVTLENSHSHELVRKLVKKEIVQKPFAGFEDFAACERANQDKDNPSAFCAFLKDRVEKIEKEYNEENEKPEKESHTDDKTLSKSVSTLNTDVKKGESFIKNNVLNKNMAEDETPVEDTKKVEEVPMAADSETPVEDPMTRVEAKLDQLIEILSNSNKTEEPEEEKKPEEEVEKEEDKDDDKDKKEVEKEGDGEEVKLPESTGDEVSQDKPAEGAKSDEGKANFLEKEGIEKIKADVKADIMKELQDKRADTPRPGIKANDIKKSEEPKVPKNSIEANKMIRKMGLR